MLSYQRDSLKNQLLWQSGSSCHIWLMCLFRLLIHKFPSLLFFCFFLQLIFCSFFLQRKKPGHLFFRVSHFLELAVRVPGVLSAVPLVHVFPINWSLMWKPEQILVKFILVTILARCASIRRHHVCGCPSVSEAKGSQRVQMVAAWPVAMQFPSAFSSHCDHCRDPSLPYSRDVLSAVIPSYLLAVTLLKELASVTIWLFWGIIYTGKAG